MTTSASEIRICISCGLRYPLVEGHPFGTRCPVCLGETRMALRRQLNAEPGVTYNDKEERRRNMAVLLDNIRSAWNVGSILRSADGFGLAHVYLCGITPTPDNEAVTKTSLGAEDSLPWSYHKDAVKVVKGLKTEGWKVFALEEDARAVSINNASSTEPRRALGASAHDTCLGGQCQGVPGSVREREVLIVGNEVTGVDPELLNLCEQIFHIPMRGAKKSFNVAIAFSIAAYALSAQRIED